LNKKLIFLVFIFLDSSGQAMNSLSVFNQQYASETAQASMIDSGFLDKKPTFLGQIYKKIKSKTKKWPQILKQSFKMPRFLLKDHRNFFKNEPLFFSREEAIQKNCRNFIPLNYSSKFDASSLLNSAYTPYILFSDLGKLREGAFQFLQEMFLSPNLNEFLVLKNAHHQPIIIYVDELTLSFLQHFSFCQPDSNSWETYIEKSNVLLIGTVKTSAILLQKKTIYKNILALNLSGVSDPETLKCLKHKDLKKTAVNFYQNGDILEFMQGVHKAQLSNVKGLFFDDISFFKFTDPEYQKKNTSFLFQGVKKVVIQNEAQFCKNAIFPVLARCAPNLESLSLPDFSNGRSIDDPVFGAALKKMTHLKALHVHHVRISDFPFILLNTPQLKLLDTTSFRISEIDSAQLMSCKKLTDHDFSEILSFAALKGRQNCRLQGLFPVHFPCPKNTLQSDYFFHDLTCAYALQPLWQDLSMTFFEKEDVQKFLIFLSQTPHLKRVSLDFTHQDILDSSLEWDILKKALSVKVLRLLFSFKGGNSDFFLPLLEAFPPQLQSVFFSFPMGWGPTLTQYLRDLIYSKLDYHKLEVHVQLGTQRM
jgi:hypothetical protein